MTDSSIPVGQRRDAWSPQVVTGLTQLQSKVVSRWPVTVHSRPRQALVLLQDGIAIVCDDQTYLTTELDAFSRITFLDDTHVSVRMWLKKVDVEFANAAEAQHFRNAVSARTSVVPAAGHGTRAPLKPSDASARGKPARSTFNRTLSFGYLIICVLLDILLLTQLPKLGLTWVTVFGAVFLGYFTWRNTVDAFGSAS